MPTYDATRYSVETKAAWSDAWVIDPYLECLGWVQAVAPSRGSASFLWRAGRIKRESATAFDLVQPISPLGRFVRVWALGDDTGQESCVFTGRFVAESALVGGTAQGEWVDQQLTAFDLSHELDRRFIRQSWCLAHDGPSGVVSIDTPIAFNQRSGRGFSTLGNRSATQQPVEDKPGVKPGVKSYVFAGRGASATSPAAVWRASDILSYLLSRIWTGWWSWTVTGQYQALDAMEIPEISLYGRTLFDALNLIIDRRRGLGWHVRVAAGNESQDVELVIFTTVGTAVSFGSGTLPANSDIADLQLDTVGSAVSDLPGLTESVFQNTTATRYGTIVVAGAPVLSVFSLACKAQGVLANGNLEKGWSSDLEGQYKAAAGIDGIEGAGDLNDQFRSNDAFDRVYRVFRVKRTWDWVQEGNPVNPRLTDLGFFEIGGDDKNVAAPRRGWGQRLCRQLPFPRDKSSTDQAALDPAPEYRDLCVWIKHPVTGTYVQLDAADGIGAVRPLDNEIGFEITTAAGRNHVLALNHWTGNPSPSTFVPAAENAYDYEELVATVALRLDERLRVVVSAAGGDPHHVLYEDVPDAEMWYVAPGTATRIDTDGTLITDYATPTLLRDDSPRLRQIAAMLAVWHGTNRSPATLSGTAVWTGQPLGRYIRKALRPGSDIDVNSVITQISVTLSPSARTTIRTQYAELDVPGKSNARETVR